MFLVLHCIADYPLQGDFLANFKGKNDFVLLVHSIIWSGVVSFGFLYIGKQIEVIFPVLLVGHFFIDRWKSKKIDKTNKTNALTKDLYIDQALHAIQIAACFAV
jgi:hypothetical protein